MVSLRRTRIFALFLCLLLLFSLLPSYAADTASAKEGSDALVSLIAKYEGFSPTKVWNNGSCYIGYGCHCSKNDYPNGITQEQAIALMRQTLDKNADILNSFLTTNGITLTQNQFDALMDFSYNLGTAWITRVCRLRTALMDGSIFTMSEIELVNLFGTWCHIDKTVSAALATRRIMDALLFGGNYTIQNGTYTTDTGSYVYLSLNAASGSVDTDVYFYRKGSPYGSLPAATRSGYTLNGWKTADGTFLTASTVAKTNRSVTAVWTTGSSMVFSDVPANAWYADYVQALCQAGIVNGYTDGTFRPSKAVSIGEALKLILLAAGYEEQAAVGSHWASGYYAFAVDSGFLTANNADNLNTAASRSLIAVLAASALGLTLTNSAASPFADTDDPETVALYNAGIVEGSLVNGERLYKPADGIKRSEICAIITRINAYTKTLEAEQNVQEPVDPCDDNTSDDISENTSDDTSIVVEKSVITQAEIDAAVAARLASVPATTYTTAAEGGFMMDGNLFITDENGRKTYNAENVRTVFGIDVSYYQGTVDWEAVAADGVEFVMIRIGYRGFGSSGTLVKDPCFDANYEGAKAAGLKVGVYFFSQAITVEEAREEAVYTLTLLGDRELDYPVAFDWETYDPAKKARTDNLPYATVDACAKAFCEIIAAAGCVPMVYFNRSMSNSTYSLNDYSDTCALWFARYNSNNIISYPLNIWQYQDEGHVNGISGYVDLDLSLELIDPVKDVDNDTVDVPTDVPTDDSDDTPTDVPTDDSDDTPTDVPTDDSDDVPTDVPTDDSDNTPTDVPTDDSGNVPTEQ